MKPFYFVRSLAASAAIGITLITGCSVTQTRQGYQFGLDGAELFGTAISTFKLADGSDGALRRGPNGDYSLKLQRYFRVLPLEKAQGARIAQVATVAGQTSVLVETQEKNCGLRYSLFSIEGSHVRNWVLGNCTDRPRVFMDGDMQVFEFPAGRTITRYELSSVGLTSHKYTPTADYVFTRPFANENLQMPGAGSSPYATTTQQGSTIRDGRVIPPPPVHVAAVRNRVDEKADFDGQSGRTRTQPKPRPTGPVTQPDLDLKEDVRPTRVVDLLK